MPDLLGVPSAAPPGRFEFRELLTTESLSFCQGGSAVAEEESPDSTASAANAAGAAEPPPARACFASCGLGAGGGGDGTW